jgi:hypothetical protein
MGAVLSLAAAPIGMMGTCCGSILGSCAASMACKACSCTCAVPNKLAKYFYNALLVVTCIAAVFFKCLGGDIVIGGTTNATVEQSLEQQIKNAVTDHAKSSSQDWWNDRFGCAAAHPDGWIICCRSTCGGVFSVYRFSFTLCVFFATLALFTAAKSKVGAKAHRGFWFLKLTFLIGLLVSTLFIENATLVGYRDAARVLSLLFLLILLVILIDWGYTVNETLIAWDDDSDYEGACGWRMGIVVLGLGMYAASLTGWVLLYVYYGHPECPLQQTLISLTLLLSLALTAVSCSKIAPHGTLLVSGIVTLYTTYLCWSALAESTDTTCNPFPPAECSSWDMIFGGLVMALCILFSANSASSAELKMDSVIHGDPQGTSATSDLEKPLDDSANPSSDEEDEVHAEAHWHYHGMMAMAALYMAMLLTEWSDVAADAPPDDFKAGRNPESLWIKIASQWVCLAIYAWSLLAPYLLRNHRDFGIDFSDFD